MECPIMQHLDKPEFIAVAHNPSDRTYNRFVKIRVPHNNYRVSHWCKKTHSFVETPIDILEQNHFNISSQTKDFEIFAQVKLAPNEVRFLIVQNLNLVEAK